MTMLESALFDDWESWEEDRFSSLQWVEAGERLTRDTFIRNRKEGGGVIIHSRTEEMTRAAIENPLTIIASTCLQKYDDVCWERDGDQIEARRRVDARASARRNNKEMGPSRPNPAGGRGLRAISLSFVVNDTTASPPPLFATSPRKPHPQTLSYFCK